MKRDFVKNGLLVLCSLLFFFALLEGLCRLFPVHEAVDVDKLNLIMMNVGDKATMHFVEDPQLGYRMVVSQPDPAIFEDAWGRRYPRKKPEGVVRIVCVGGSTTYGTGADASTTFPALFEALCNRSHPGCPRRVEVINAGLMGYNSWHSRIRADVDLDSLDPDLYVVMDGLNDVVTSMSVSRKALNRLDVLTSQVNLRRGVFGEALARLVGVLDHSALFTRLRRLYRDLGERGSDTPGQVASNVAGFGYKKNMMEFIQGRREKGIRTALLNYPWIVRESADFSSETRRLVYPLDPNYFRYFQAGRAYVTQANVELASTMKVPLADPQPLLDELTRDGANLYRYYVDTVHFTKFANFYIALSLFERLKNVEPLKSAFAGCASENLDTVVSTLWPQVFIPEHAMLGTGFPKNPASGYATRVVSRQNTEEKPADVAGWTVYSPRDPARPATLVLERTPRDDAAERRVNGFNCMVFPRFVGDRDSVTIHAGEQVVLQAKKSLPSPGWTPIAERWGCVLPPSATRLEIVLTGQGQLWAHDRTVLFYNPF
ncbi:hypothetical protein JCM15519_35570 [Fundidesulfovibrio butyratiphilus]